MKLQAGYAKVETQIFFSQRDDLKKLAALTEQTMSQLVSKLIVAHLQQHRDFISAGKAIETSNSRMYKAFQGNGRAEPSCDCQAMERDKLNGTATWIERGYYVGCDGDLQIAEMTYVFDAAEIAGREAEDYPWNYSHAASIQIGPAYIAFHSERTEEE